MINISFLDLLMIVENITEEDLENIDTEEKEFSKIRNVIVPNSVFFLEGVALPLVGFAGVVGN